jgi:hypothetical protein
MVEQWDGHKLVGVDPEKMLGLGSVPKEVFSVSSWHHRSHCYLTLILENQPVQTPSTHRQRLASGNCPPQIGLPNVPGNGVSGAPMPQHRISPRQPLANLNGNSPGPSGFAGYGMSAGMKVSNQAGSGASGFSRPIVRSRGKLMLG